MINIATSLHRLLVTGISLSLITQKILPTTSFSNDIPSPKFNFGPASKRAPLLHGVEAPGVPMKPGGKYNDPQSVPNAAVQEWITYMKENDVKRTLCLLKPDELSCYADPGYESLLSDAGIRPTVVNVFEEGSRDECLRAYEEAVAAGEKVAVHCSGGEGRTGLV
eukprot:CAMPEP_0172498026 /NCGR_PEP_ID=MMETSP1066-20121228/108382_1 /TAXON_ID=671091 /ORGANISM="Coscinodiscus wailesii, Strain CCMP2513" /LENGTH=164 /DNA_ID=CAMNT_0013271125 /DNA_START=75 /DNA_END=566 /DNA_ORIENTATION=+